MVPAERRHSGVLLNQLLQAVTVSPAAGEFFTALQHDNVLAAIARLQFLYLADIYDGGAVDANKLRGVEPLREAADGLAQKIRVFPHIQFHVVCRRLNPVNIVKIQKDDTATCFHDQAPIHLPTVFYIGEQIEDSMG